MNLPADFTPAPDSLRSRIILITGAGDGLGRATAIAAAKAGATVILLGRTIKKLEVSYDAIEQAGGAKPGIVPMNLNGASWNEHQQLADTLEQEFGRLDGLVHCAAHFTGFVRLAELPPKDWLDSLQTNLTAAYVLSRCCLPLLQKSTDSRLIFTSDAGGRTPKPYQGAYGIAKTALEAMAAMWAQECATTHPQLRIHTYNPGAMRTAIRIKGYAGEGERDTPPPDAAARRLVWLLSAEGRKADSLAL